MQEKSCNGLEVRTALDAIFCGTKTKLGVF